MKKLFFIASIMFLCGISCIARTIKQVDFDTIVDYVNCVYAKAYIEKTGKGDDLKAYNNKIKPELEKNCSFDKHLPFDKLYKLLNENSWGKTADNLIKARKDDKKFDASKTDSAIIEYIVEISGKFKDVIGDELIQKIATELKERYSNKPEKDTTTFAPPDSETIDKSECHWGIWLPIISIVAILLSVFCLCRLCRCCGKLKRMVLENESVAKLSDVKMFEAKLQQLERKFGDLQEEVKNKKSEQSIPNTTKAEKDVYTDVNEVKTANIKFFRTKKEKTLQDELPSDSGASFKIFKINDNEAKFEYCGGIINPDFFAEICDFENNPAEISPKKEIITTIPGTVKKDNNSWVIDKPAKIKFI